MHTAAKQGWPGAVFRLKKFGYDPLHKDPYGHGAIDIACMQRWTMAEIKLAFGDGAFEYCTDKYGQVQQPTKPYTFTEAGGGWQHTSYEPEA